MKTPATFWIATVLGLMAFQLPAAPLEEARKALELQLFKLRTQKSVLEEDEYYKKLELLLLQLARLYQDKTE